MAFDINASRKTARVSSNTRAPWMAREIGDALSLDLESLVLERLPSIRQRALRPCIERER